MAKAKQQAPKKEAAPKAPGTRSDQPPRMLKTYRDSIVQQMTKEFDYANVMLVCPHCGRPTRTKHIVLESGARALVCRQCGEPYERVRKTEAQ